MAYSVSGGEPGIDVVLGSAFADSFELSKKNLAPALVMIVLGALIGLVFALTSRGQEDMLQGALFGCDIAIVVVSYYAIAAAVRTLNPSYRMTVGQFFGILGYSLLAGLLTMIASFVFVIPAFWVGPKVLLTPYVYAITNGAPGALEKSWNMTTGYYWPTLGFYILLGLAVGVLAMIAFGIAGAISYAVPFTAIVAIPVAIAILVWLLHVQALAYVRWTASLLQRIEPATTPVIA